MIKLSKIIYLFKKLSFLNLKNFILLHNSLFYRTFIMKLKYGVITIKNRLHSLIFIQKKSIPIINNNMVDRKFCLKYVCHIQLTYSNIIIF